MCGDLPGARLGSAATAVGFYSFFRSILQPAGIRFVLRPADGPLVPDQMLPADQGNLESADGNLFTLRPRLVEIDTIDRCR